MGFTVISRKEIGRGRIIGRKLLGGKSISRKLVSYMHGQHSHHEHESEHEKKSGLEKDSSTIKDHIYDRPPMRENQTINFNTKHHRGYDKSSKHHS